MRLEAISYYKSTISEKNILLSSFCLHVRTLYYCFLISHLSFRKRGPRSGRWGDKEEPMDLRMFKRHLNFSLRCIRGVGAEGILQNTYLKFGPCFLQKRRLYTLSLSQLVCHFLDIWIFYLICPSQSLKCHHPCSPHRLQPQSVWDKVLPFTAEQGRSCFSTGTRCSVIPEMNQYQHLKVITVPHSCCPPATQEQLSFIKLSIFNLMVFQELKVVNSSLAYPLALWSIASSQFSSMEELSSSLLAWKCSDKNASLVLFNSFWAFLHSFFFWEK